MANNPSYANPGGTGNRTSMITVTTTVSTVDDIEHFVDGVNPQNDFYFNYDSAAGKYLRFDFGPGASKLITEAKFYQSEVTSQGIWEWQGSNDALVWTIIGGTFNLCATSATDTLATLSGNTLGYRYYQMYGVTGGTSGDPFLYEIEFKIDDFQLSTTYFGSSSVSDGTAVGSSVHLGSVVSIIQTIGADVYFDTTAEISRVDAYYVHQDGRQGNRIIHRYPNFTGSVTWSPYARDGTWQKTQVVAYDFEGATATIPRAYLTSEDLTHSDGTMNLNT